MEPKTVVIIPGCNECLFARRAYIVMARTFADYGWSVVPVEINWEKQNFADWKSEMLEQVDMCASRVDLCIGFSYGAVLALELSKVRNVDVVFAASVSPVYEEQKGVRAPDMAKREDVQHEGRRPLMSDLKLSRASLVRHFIGTNDYPHCMQDAENVVKAIGADRASCTWIPEATHDVDHEAYLKTLFGAICEQIKQHMKAA